MPLHRTRPRLSSTSIARASDGASQLEFSSGVPVEDSGRDTAGAIQRVATYTVCLRALPRCPGNADDGGACSTCTAGHVEGTNAPLATPGRLRPPNPALRDASPADEPALSWPIPSASMRQTAARKPPAPRGHLTHASKRTRRDVSARSLRKSLVGIGPADPQFELVVAAVEDITQTLARMAAAYGVVDKKTSQAAYRLRESNVEKEKAIYAAMPELASVSGGEDAEESDEEVATLALTVYTAVRRGDASCQVWPYPQNPPGGYGFGEGQTSLSPPPQAARAAPPAPPAPPPRPRPRPRLQPPLHAHAPPLALPLPADIVQQHNAIAHSRVREPAGQPGAHRTQPQTQPQAHGGVVSVADTFQILRAARERAEAAHARDVRRRLAPAAVVSALSGVSCTGVDAQVRIGHEGEALRRAVQRQHGRERGCLGGEGWLFRVGVGSQSLVCAHPILDD
ncbi:hypothetical protein BJ912DRAFT_929264 [Pholiota molesta]|nr:hypothetical protein BJ912DRAFT_929264 [Pholiota molesta]